MKDVSGRKLEVGHKVKWCRANWSTLHWFVGTVEKFTPRTVKIVLEYKNQFVARDYLYIQDPENRVVIIQG